ncbi:Thermophilic metalloprotease (M29) [Eubacterium ruminantium]|nr:Thermophilic metalloprotease (M29) [Eubacterium ruminantium]
MTIDLDIKERFELAYERIRQISEEASSYPEGYEEAYYDYFKNVSEHIIYVLNAFGVTDTIETAMTEDSENDNTAGPTIENKNKAQNSLEYKRERNEKTFREISEEGYKASYLNPAYAAEKLGSFGKVLSFIYSEIFSFPMLAADEKYFDIVILMELFIEVYIIFSGEEKPGLKAVEEAVYYYGFDYAEELIRERIEEILLPVYGLSAKICMEADLGSEDYLYEYGEYIGENEIGLAKYLAKLPEEKINLLADTFVGGFRRGFITMNVPFEGKKTVNIRYSIGQERIVRAAIKGFEKIGLKPILCRYATSRINRKQVIRQGFTNISLNMQFDYDHRNDDAFFLNKRFVERKLDIMRKVYEEYKEDAAVYAGPAVIESFGEVTRAPQAKDDATVYTDAQQKLYVDFQSRSGEIVNEYIPGDKYSFTIIAFPVPEVHENFEEVFEDTIKLNTLDSDKYTRIHQSIIDCLDKASYIKVEGRNGNKTDMHVTARVLADPQHESQFENCVADVNIPVGEVFTSPVLEGTHGTLHVSQVYLNGLLYKNLEMKFEDGCITDYTCSNFEEEEKNRAYIKENVLQNRDTLPLGEFAIGTNTAAYSMARKYDIMGKLPILIMEKTGPHFAVGDTCYRHSEDTRIFNPDGKEIVSKENSFSALRDTEPEKAYFNCHTDITIPFDELGRIYTVDTDDREVDIIRDGRFVLPGTEELNESL